MKRNANHLMPTDSINLTGFPIYIPEELITKIAAMCQPQARTCLALVNKYFNHSASIKNNPAILYDEEFYVDKKDRLYYLFYGCIHNIKSLVHNALKKFDSEKKEMRFWNGQEHYPDKKILSEAKYYIEQFTPTDANELLPFYPDTRIYKTKPLYWAANQKQKNLFELLLKQPTVNINYQENQSHLPILFYLLLSSAEDNDSLSMIKLLLDQASININLQMIDENTPLHHAISRFKSKSFNLLLTHPDIIVNMQNDLGNTPLHLAAKYNCLDNVKRLLTHPDINLHIRNNDGQTPLALANIHQKQLADEYLEFKSQPNAITHVNYLLEEQKNNLTIIEQLMHIDGKSINHLQQ